MSQQAAMRTAVEIFINGHKFEVPTHELTGKQLKELGNVPENEALYLGVRDDEQRIRDDQMVHLKSGEHFDSSPDGGVS